MHTSPRSWVSMNRSLTRLIAVFACVLLVCGAFATHADAAAGVPRIMNYQGRLMNSSGTLLGGSGTDYCVKFSLYDDATVGGPDTQLWPASAPSTMTVTVRNGIFNAGVGDTNAGGDTLDFNFEDTDAAYLNVQVATKVGATCAAGDGAESFENLSPRQRVTASGYAINSATLNGQTGAYYLANSFSTTSATVFTNSFVGSSTTIPKTFSNNTFVGINAFADITVVNATSTNLNIGGTFSGAGLTSCSGSNDKLVWNASTRQFACDTDLSGSGGADGNWTFFNNTGIRPATTSNQVLVGGTATTSLAKFEAQGGAKFDNATSTTLNTTVFGLGGTEYFTSLAGTGLQNIGGVLTLSTSGDWTGTLDGFEASYLLANSFSTTSASYFASHGLAFSTTSAQYFMSQNPAVFATSSADYWKSQNNFHSTSSFAYDLSTYDKGFFFSTTSVAHWDSTQFRWATTSTDSWFAAKSTDDLDEGVSNLYYTPNRVAGVIAGTTTDALAEGVSNRYFTTNRFATVLAATTTDALAQGSVNRYYANELVDAHVGASTTIAKTFTDNTFTGTNGFQNVTASGVTSTASFATTASSSNLFSGIANIGSLIATAITGNTITATNATSATLFTNFSSSTETRANTASFGSMIAGSSTVAATSTTGGLFASFSRMIAAVIDSLTASVLTAFNGTFGNLTATSSATLASTTAYGRFITGNIVATSSNATSTFSGAMVIGTSSGSYKVSVLGNTTGASGATSTAIMAISNDDGTLSSGNNVLRLNIRTPYGTTCTSGTTCPRFTEYFASVPSGSDTGGRGVGSLRLSTAGTGITQTSGAADFAEFMQLSESAAVGDIVSLNANGEYRKATAGEALIGVVSDNAAFVGNGNLEGEPNAYIVGFAGVIRTTVSDANGDINAGDLIAASDVPGVGIKLSESGYALGQALQSHSGPGVGTITVLVMPKFVDAAIALDSYGGGASGASGYWDLSTTTNAVSLASTTHTLAIAGNTQLATTTIASLSTTGTTTGANGMNITDGCYAIDGVCLTTGGSSASSTLFSDTNSWTGINTFTGNSVFGNATSTTMRTSVLGIGLEYFTSLAGSGLLNTAGVLSLDRTGDWTGTLDGREGSYYLANSFSTSSASHFAAAGLAFSTSSADYYASQNPDSAFATSSADYWKTQNNFFSTSSSAFFAASGLSFSTSSTDYWRSVNNFFSTTSASHFSSLGLSFSTTSASYFLGQNLGNAFSTTSASHFVNSSTTIPKTYTNNVFTGVNDFANITATNATTTSLFATFASTTEMRANTASFGSAAIGSLTTVGTTTGSNGFDISSGCFSINGVCIASDQGGGGGSGVLIAIQTFSAVGTTTYTPSAGATSAQVIVTGGGGGGGGADSDGATVEVPAGGAGAGATAFLVVDLTATTSVQVVVGAGGTGGTAAAGGTGVGGGHSSFGPALGRAGGGFGGVGATSADTTAGPRTLAGGAGGSATAGDVQIAGGNGQDGNSQVGNTAFGGLGGSSYWGGGGDGGSVVVTATQSAGSNATAYGAGGGGAALADTATGAAGGNGANGIVVVYEYGPFQGTMNVANGGTGLSSGPAYGQLLMGDGAGGYTLVATSSLGLATTTDSLTEGVVNRYYTDERVNSFVGASTTVAKSFTANIFTALQTFANAIFGNITVSGTASSTNVVASSGLTFGTFTGVLKSTAGVVTAALVDLANDVTGVLGITNGGTGTSTAPALGQLLVGSGLGGYDLIATSTLGIYISDTTGTLDETRGGTGNTSYTAGDILYALNGSTLVPLPAGGNGSVLKMAGGLPAWGTDLQGGGGGGGGGGGFFSTTTDDLAIFPSNPTYAVIVGNSATTTDDASLEVFGKSYFSNRMGIATSSAGSIFSIGGVANFSTLGSTMYTKLNLIDVEASGASSFASVVAATLAATNVGGGSLLAGTTATTTIQGDATGTSTIQGFINVTGTNSTSTFSGSLQALSIQLTATSTAAGFNMTSGCYAINGICTVNSLTATNTTLTTTGTNGAIGISLNLANPNVWSGLQQFGTASTSLLEATRFYARTIQSTSTNALALQSNLSSTAGLTFGSTSTPNVLGIDTINNRVTLGTGGAFPSLLVLDNKNTSGDPSGGVAGAMYYNSNDGLFRCFNTSWVTCGGQAASSTGDVQFRNVDGSFTATSNFNWSLANNRLSLTANANQATDIFTVSSSTGETLFSIGNTGVLNLATTSDQSAPTSGLDIYAKAIANRVVPKWVGPSGVDTPFQSAIWQNNLVFFTPGAAAGLWQGTAGSNLGTAAVVLPTTTNFWTSSRRSRFSSVVTTLNQQVGTRTDAMFFRGGSAGQGGFFMAARVGTDTWTAGDRLFVGFSTGTTAVCTVNPTTLTNSVGFVVNAGSTTISFMHNDGSGNAVVETITNQPALASNQGYAFYIFAKPNDSVIYWQLDDINTGLKLEEGSVSADLPVNTTMMAAHACMSNGANTVVNNAQIGINRIYIETDR